MPTYHGQIGQDYLLDEAVFRGMRDGTFIDIGANDGVFYSNSVMFERDRGWSGVCVEPNPAVFPKLIAQRGCPCVNAAVGAERGVLPFEQVVGYGQMLSGLKGKASRAHDGRIQHAVEERGSVVKTIDVDVITFPDIIRQHDIKNVDLLTVDTEGNEPEILATIAEADVMVHVIDVECNDDSDVPILTDVLGDQFKLIARHRFDAFFINRESPFFGRRRRLKKLIASEGRSL
ncbi:FkbM family methyltransferase [Bauldia litoralis]|uniref:Methyltransferase, FkbM family n=1 Tax=Bauldia litoralis TaxID=665467 RepID=A0A1G6CV87_9HYPH|nr:FkbM family methyltransferase [Bauldia litoralis]SDB36742.1 methyltransferase, FkbM family [Bauldia litoralis]